MVARLEQQLRASGKLPEGTQFVRREDGAAKISATFLRFIEPYRYAATNRQQFADSNGFCGFGLKHELVGFWTDFW